MPCNHPKKDGQTDDFGEETLPSPLRHPFNRGDPATARFRRSTIALHSRASQGRFAPRPRGGSCVALLDSPSASGMFLLCPKREKAPFPGLVKRSGKPLSWSHLARHSRIHKRVRRSQIEGRGQQMPHPDTAGPSNPSRPSLSICSSVCSGRR